MKKKHSYATDSRDRLKMWAILASASYGTIILISLTTDFFNNLFGITPGITIPLTFGIIFSGLFFLYNKFGWKTFGTDIHDLSGTWVGCAIPNYQSHAHLAIVAIEQTWSEIYIYETSHYKKLGEKWDSKRVLGTNETFSASIQEDSDNRCTVTVIYTHTGSKPGQPSGFRGTWILTHSKEDNELRGTYFTERKDPTSPSHKEGSLGPILLKRVSSSILSRDETFRNHLKVAEAIEAELITQMEV